MQPYVEYLRQIAENTGSTTITGSENLSSVGGVAVATGSGAPSTGSQRVTPSVNQYTGVPSSFTIQTADATVFTLAAGEIGFIQNLSADAPLAVKKGASASTTSLNFILATGVTASDGKGGSVLIDDWVGAVSVAKMTGTASYIAWKVAP